MADEADITTARAEIEDKIKRKYTEAFKSAVADDCIECGTFIPLIRQKATGGCDTCITCQSLYEEKTRFNK
jgi:RNA polymerase-binding transcription factor DksA